MASEPVPPTGAGRQLAGGTFIISIGLGISGLATIGMIALAARTLEPDEYAAFAVWWTVATLIASAFGVFEAYLARLTITELARGADARPVTAIMTGRALVVLAFLAMSLVVLAPFLSDQLFADNRVVPLVLPLFLCLASGQSIQRGFATGHRNYAAVGAQLATDGTLRFGLVAALTVLGDASLTSYSLACCLAAAGSLTVATRLSPGWLTVPKLRGRHIPVAPLIYLLIGSVGPLLANNGSVPWLAGTHSVDARVLGAFAAAVTLSRIPTQFVTAVFGPLLAQLSHAVETADERVFHKLRRYADTVATGLGIVYIAAFALLGPWIMSIYLGPGYELDVLNLAVLAAASSAMFVAVVQQASLAALDSWPRIAAAWTVGTAGFLLTLLLPVDTLTRATFAPLVGVLLALLMLIVFSRRGWERRVGQSGTGAELPPR
jgi:O-antigen/teichoic acid export membrane protein